MMRIRDFVRGISPTFLLEAFRKFKKEKRNAVLEKQKKTGKGITKEALITQFKAAGIKRGDTVLVHSSLSKIGFIAGGPQTFVDAILELVSTEGNVLMPTSPNGGLQLDYVKSLTLFDVQEMPSSLGAITECFRKQKYAIRSNHPTEPVSCIGKDAAYLTANHEDEVTPYGANSPWTKITEFNAKILYIGVTLANAGTSLHTLEDAVAFKYPVYYPEIFRLKLKTNSGSLIDFSTKIHNPEYSKKRKCDDLLPMFLQEGVAFETTIGEAKTYVFNAKKMLSTMIEKYEQEGITMYTPGGS